MRMFGFELEVKFGRLSFFCHIKVIFVTGQMYCPKGKALTFCHGLMYEGTTEVSTVA